MTTTDKKVRILCVEDDAQGQRLEVLWDIEPDARAYESDRWNGLGTREFDDSALFAAYLNTLRWNCVTATDATLLQAPFRAGIRIEDYQLEPLRKALRLPRVNLFIADDVGLGKTIETALILRELASRGELNRALMVVPAGLVHNWHRELNEVFHLNFEVFGSEGDVTDRKSNAFEKHNLLIASIDTLKVRSRMARLKTAPPWDLVVFDEAHHLTAYRQNGKLVKTQNFKLAEMLKEHTRDLVLLSATPHQGDHFRFWMLVQMLDPTLFDSPAEMVEHLHDPEHGAEPRSHERVFYRATHHEIADAEEPQEQREC